MCECMSLRTGVSVSLHMCAYGCARVRMYFSVHVRVRACVRVYADVSVPEWRLPTWWYSRCKSGSATAATPRRLLSLCCYLLPSLSEGLIPGPWHRDARWLRFLCVRLLLKGTFARFPFCLVQGVVWVCLCSFVELCYLSFLLRYQRANYANFAF